MAARDGVLEYLEGQLLGPTWGPTEVLPEHDPPNDRYLLGTLFPQQLNVDQAFEDDIIDDNAGEVGDNLGDDPIVLANQRMPSSVGLSLLVDGSALRIEVTGGTYEGIQRHEAEVSGVVGGDPEKQVKTWTRSLFLHEKDLSATGRQRLHLQPGLELSQRWRPAGEGKYLVTVAVVNANKDSGRPKPGDCFFQVSLRCKALDGSKILPYPSTDVFHLDEESEEQALIYSDVLSYAIGHGCAADWFELDSREAEWVGTTFIPQQVVPQVSFDIEGHDEVRRFVVLAELENAPGDILPLLREFVEAYGSWAGELRERSRNVQEKYEQAAERLLGRIDQGLSRMRDGVALLENDPDARTAFALANRAMVMQMRHGKLDYGGRRKRKGERPFVVPDYGAALEYQWRPFQLAFLLLVLGGVTDEASADREIVDLIWFPTGGGKTEAYLGLVAYTIFLRRLRDPEAGGTAVITRYTLRLLTTQQFQRAAALILACELLRKGEPRLGLLPITIGIWVGQASTPNSFADAVEDLDKHVAGEFVSRSFQIEICPWCGTELLTDDDDDEQGVVATDASFLMRCRSGDCPFSSRLPVSPVDDDLYQNPPTMLLATVDKFAQVVWRPRAAQFLGAGSLPGPDLIIQDELHLISGPLGTMVALYERGFDMIIEEKWRRPKVVASTATIRNAGPQVRGVFGREVYVFPASGLEADDSYFVRFDSSGPGRLYAGVMSQAHTTTTAMVRVAAGLLQAPVELGLSGDDLDSFSTLVAYHNSLRELGKTVTLVRDDISAWMELTASDQAHFREIDPDNVLELTSNIPGSDIPRNLERLGIPADRDDSPVFLACTNMISVGVDVPRLGLMLVHGQPKSTSEYIQATSRVGRLRPGLVVTLFSSAKSRDRSHYETFRPYHQSLYRHVEASAVTPFAVPARVRALPAVLVLLARYIVGPPENDGADQIEPANAELQRIIGRLIEQVRAIDPAEATDTQEHVDLLLEEWAAKTALADREGTGTLFYETQRPHTTLLKHFNQAGDAWPVPDSMRSVDVEALVKVRGT